MVVEDDKGEWMPGEGVDRMVRLRHPPLRVLITGV